MAISDRFEQPLSADAQVLEAAPGLTAVNSVPERVNCMSFLARRFMRYAEGDLFDIPGLSNVLEEAEAEGLGRIAQEPHITVASSRRALEMSSHLRSKDVSYVDIVQAAKRVASKQPRSLSGTISKAEPFGAGVHVAFIPDSKLMARIVKDRTVMARCLKGSMRPETPHLSVMKAASPEAAVTVSDRLNDIIGDVDLPLELGELFVCRAVSRGIPAGLARDLHAVVKDGQDLA
jgi:hypothetical protein